MLEKWSFHVNGTEEKKWQLRDPSVVWIEEEGGKEVLAVALEPTVWAVHSVNLTFPVPRKS